METVKEHLQIRDTKEVIATIEKTFQRIEKFAKENDYSLSNKLEFDKTKLADALNDTSLRKRKVLRRYMFKIEHHATLDVVNKFLHFLYKTVLKSDYRVKVTKSEKEQRIIKARQEYKAALKTLLEKQQLYKVEKGDFYKNRITKKQAI